LGIWFTEKRPVPRWFGAAAIFCLLAAFGQLHGVLIGQVKTHSPGTPLVLPGPTAMALTGALFAVMLAALLTLRAPGCGLRWLGIALLIGVMIQGLLGGLRVYLNALWGQEISAIHGSFAQIVLALGVVVVVRTSPPNPPLLRRSPSLVKWAWLAAA